jgi:hypothetical protein
MVVLDKLPLQLLLNTTVVKLLLFSHSHQVLTKVLSKAV